MKSQIVRTAGGLSILSPLPLELQFLIHLTRDQNDAALAAALSARNDIDWRKFIELAEHHRVECLVALNLAAHKSADVPDTVRDHFADRLRCHSLDSLAINRATIEVTNALRDANISYILLKGSAVANRFYRSPNARQCKDIDILVAEDELIGARSIVENLGFKQYSPDFDVPPRCEGMLRAFGKDVAFIRSNDGVQLELHWRLFGNRHLLNWDFDAASRFTTQMPLAGASVMVLEPVAQLIYLVCHGAEHKWFRLKWLADIYRILTVLTDEQSTQVVEMSQRYGTMRILATSLELTRIMYATSLESIAGGQLRPHQDGYQLKHMIDSILLRTEPTGVQFTNIGNYLQNWRYNFNLRPDLSYKTDAIVKTFVKQCDIKTLKLSRKWLWLYLLAGPYLAAIRMCDREIKSRWRSG